MQRDVMLRWLHQISLLIRRLLYGPGPVDIELAEEHLDEGLQQHLGPMVELIPRLDAESAANLLNDPERIFGYAQLVGLQAEILAAKADTTAPTVRTRSLELAKLAINRSPDPPAEWKAWLSASEAG